jgi:hypothetical protein
MISLPLPNIPASKLRDPGAFPSLWAERAADQADVIERALLQIGATLTPDVNDEFRYFVLTVGNRTFTLGYEWIARFDIVSKLAKKNRMATIKAIADDYIKAYDGANKDIFYSGVQSRIKSLKDFASKKDEQLNYLIFHILCDFLRDAGFRFHMD